MAKKSFTSPPKAKRQPTPDQIAQFTSGGVGTDQAEPMKRFSLDMPESMHRRLKLACVANGKKMSPEVLMLIERHIEELEAATG